MLNQDSLGTIAEAINGKVWHSGGNVYVIVVMCDDLAPDGHYIFGFADDVLGWDLNDTDGNFLACGSSDITIDQIPEVIAHCESVIADQF